MTRLLRVLDIVLVALVVALEGRKAERGFGESTPNREMSRGAALVVQAQRY